MSVDSSWDIEQYRNKFEPKDHWELKKEFLLAHKSLIPEDRLVCLSQVYVNMELLGCRYPTPTMQQVRKLAVGLGQQYHASRKNKLQRTFVKASDAALSKVRRDGPVAKEKRIQRQSIQAPEDSTSHVEIVKVVSGMSQLIRSPRKHQPISAPAKHQPISLPGKRFDIQDLIKLWSSRDPLSILVLVYRRYAMESNNPSHILLQSAQHCGMSYTVMREPLTGDCKAYIDDVELASVPDTDMKEGRNLVSLQLLTQLCNHCCLLEMKVRHDHSASVNTDDVGLGDGQNESANVSTALSDDNIGNKLLKMMGWSGGGLGKDGTGRAEPIEPNMICGRQGLGYTGGANVAVTTDFKTQIHRLVQNYVSDLKNGTATKEELVFSPAFSKEQRAFIHRVAPKYNLKHSSYGAGEKRYLVLSLKLDVWQRMLRMIREKGADNEFFTVHMPGTYDIGFFTEP